MMKTKLNSARVTLLCSLLLLVSSITTAQVRTEYRAFWVDTFNTNLNNHTDVLNVVNNAKAAKANAIFVQVRRRGDSWYLNSANWSEVLAVEARREGTDLDGRLYVVIATLTDLAGDTTMATKNIIGPHD